MREAVAAVLLVLGLAVLIAGIARHNDLLLGVGAVVIGAAVLTFPNGRVG